MVKIDILSAVIGGIVLPAVWQSIRLAWQIWKEDDERDNVRKTNQLGR